MSNLLEKASIITTPTAYSDGKLHSVKPVKTLGNEEVTNGSFDTDSDWAKNGNVTISGGTANFNNSVSGNNVQQPTTLPSGKKYIATYEITSITEGKFSIYVGGVLSGNQNNQVGVYTEVFTSIGVNQVYVRARGTTSGSIDNVSVKEVIDADFDFQRGSAATRVNSQGLIENVQTLSGNLVQNGDFSEIGSELVTNGDFATDTNWVKQAGWSINNGTANCDGTSGSLYQSSVVEIGKSYLCEFEVTSIISGSVAINAGGNTTGTPRTSIGKYSEILYVVGGSNDRAYIISQSFQGSIDNVSFKEVGQNWTITGDKWDIYQGYAELISNDSVGSSIIPNTTIVAVSKYRCSFDAVVNSGSCKFQSSSGITYQVIDETKTYNFIFTSDSSSAYFNRLSAISNITLTNISVIEITDDTDLPRIDYTDGCGSLLLEPQSTNLLLDSGFNDVSSTVAIGYWYKSPNASISENSVIGVDGLQSAATYTYNGGTTSEVIYGYQIAVTSGVTYTVSGYVKLGTAANFVIVLNNTIWWNTIPNGNFVATAVDGYDNWKRFEITFVAPSTNKVNVHLGYHQENGVAAQTNGSVFIDSFQVEQQSYPTSYIPTNGSTATRLADVCNNSGSSDLINSTEGVLYAEISALANGGFDRYISLNDNTGSNYVHLILHATDNRIAFRVNSGGVQQVNISDYNFEQTDNLKIACVYKQNNFSLWINGIERVTDISGNIPIGLNKLNLSLFNGTQPFYGNVKSLVVFKEALTNDELEGLTGEGYDTFNALALANNYTII